MAYAPAFTKDLEAFRRELASVRTAPGWLLFKQRWFSDQPSWPRRTPEALAALRPGERFDAGGRTWTRAPLPIDLEPAARYEYFAALQAGFSVVYPDPGDAPGAGGSGVRFQCPACEMWSDDQGPPACPSCGRTLLRLRVQRPPTAP